MTVLTGTTWEKHLNLAQSRVDTDLTRGPESPRYLTAILYGPDSWWLKTITPARQLWAARFGLPLLMLTAVAALLGATALSFELLPDLLGGLLGFAIMGGGAYGLFYLGDDRVVPYRDKARVDLDRSPAARYWVYQRQTAMAHLKRSRDPLSKAMLTELRKVDAGFEELVREYCAVDSALRNYDRSSFDSLDVEDAQRRRTSAGTRLSEIVAVHMAAVAFLNAGVPARPSKEAEVPLAPVPSYLTVQRQADVDAALAAIRQLITQ